MITHTRHHFEPTTQIYSISQAGFPTAFISTYHWYQNKCIILIAYIHSLHNPCPLYPSSVIVFLWHPQIEHYVYTTIQSSFKSSVIKMTMFVVIPGQSEAIVTPVVESLCLHELQVKCLAVWSLLGVKKLPLVRVKTTQCYAHSLLAS